MAQSTSLQRLRREAGFRTARSFASALDMSASRYSRYEADPTSIPITSAWAIADYLGCAIDEVVGRVDLAEGALRGRVQIAYDSLSAESRTRADDYLALLASVDEAPLRERDAHDLGMAEGAEAAAEAAGTPGAEEMFKLLEKGFEAKRRREVDAECEVARAGLDRTDAMTDELAMELEAELVAIRDASLAKRAEEDEEVIYRVMAAYAARHGDGDDK